MEYIVLRYKKRKKSIEFKIFNNKIYVYSPFNISDEYIDFLYKKNRDKLLKKIKNENLIKYLGKDYNFIIKENSLLVGPSIDIFKDNFVLYIPKNKKININKYLVNWKKEKLKAIVDDRVKYFVGNYGIFKFSFEKNKIFYKNQRTIWGSCSFCNNLNFNCNLIDKRIEIIDYVIVHELCHTLHKNHSKDFWNCVSSIIGEYKELRKELKSYF